MRGGSGVSLCEPLSEGGSAAGAGRACANDHAEGCSLQRRQFILRIHVDLGAMPAVCPIMMFWLKERAWWAAASAG